MRGRKPKMLGLTMMELNLRGGQAGLCGLHGSGSQAHSLAWLCWACPQPHDSRWQQLCSRQLLWGEGPQGQRAGPSISGKVLRSCPTSLLILHWPERGPLGPLGNVVSILGGQHPLGSMGNGDQGTGLWPLLGEYMVLLKLGFWGLF